MIPQELGKTEMGRDMLAQDYILKQLTASLIYPEKDLGKSFWKRIYTKAQEKFGTTDIPVDTFNKVWITSDKAKVLERNNTAYVVGAHLKVMLESDYTAAQNAGVETQNFASLHHDATTTQELAKQVIREVVIPEIEKEVNEGQNFAMLRQMFYSMILASWYKLALKDALLNQVYSNKAKTSGVLSDDPAVKEKIYSQYLEAYKKGVFNYIKEDLDTVSQQAVPRKYFSGGLRVFSKDSSQLIERVKSMPVNWYVNTVGKMLLASVQVRGKNPSLVKNKEILQRAAKSRDAGYFQEAIESYKSYLLRVDSQDVFVIASLGMAFKDAGNFKEALKQLEKAAGKDPQFKPDYLMVVGIAKIFQKDFKEAEKALRFVISVDTQYSLAYAYLGVALYAQGQRKEALDYYKNALKLGTGIELGC